MSVCTGKELAPLDRGFCPNKHEGYKLVLAGDTDFEDEYSRNLKAMAKSNGVS